FTTLFLSRTRTKGAGCACDPPRVAQKDNEGCLALSPRAQRCGWHSPMQVPRTRPATGHAPPRGLGLYIPQTRARCAPPGKARGSYREHPFPRGSDRKSTRLNSSHVSISYAVFCLKKKK